MSAVRAVSVTFDGYVWRTVDQPDGRDGREELVYVKELEKPLALRSDYVGPRPLAGVHHISAEARELDTRYICLHKTASVLTADEYRARLWTPKNGTPWRELRDRMSEAFLTDAVKSGAANGWQTSTNNLYDTLMPIIPGNPKTKGKRMGHSTRWLHFHGFLTKVTYDRCNRATRNFGDVRIWELAKPWRGKPLEEILQAMRDVSAKTREDDSPVGQTTLDEEDNADPDNLEM